MVWVTPERVRLKVSTPGIAGSSGAAIKLSDALFTSEINHNKSTFTTYRVHLHRSTLIDHIPV